MSATAPEKPGAPGSIAVSWPMLVVAAVAILVTTVSVVLFLFREAPGNVDQLGLFNPIYTFLTKGQMSYPVHYQQDTMTIHPPIRYLEVALLMKAGVPQYYAQSFGLLALSILTTLLLLRSRFDIYTKIGFMLAVSASVVYFAGFDGHYSLRPDMQLAVAWFAGLIALESGRIGGWSSVRLFFGGLLLTYASGLHYFAAPAFLGVGVYALWAYRTLPWHEARRPLLALAGGGLVFGLPYLFFFIIPDLEEILRSISSVQREGGILAPIVRHWDKYQYSVSTLNPFNSPFQIGSLLVPFYWVGIPVFIVGAAILGLCRSTRGIALASLPLCVFVLLVSKQKSYGYYMPETIILFAGLAIGIRIIIERAVRLHYSLKKDVVALSVLASIGSLIIIMPNNPVYAKLTPSLTPKVLESEIARAAAKEIVGPKALIGGRIGLWYISGADHWYDVASDLLWRKDISSIDLHEYFQEFDYIVEHDHMSNTTINNKLESISSWYLNGILSLHGFYYGSTHRNMNFLIFAALPADGIAGFIWRNGELRRFDQSLNGSHVFVIMVCSFEQWPAVNRFALPLFNAIFLPKAAPDDPERSYLPNARLGDPQRAVVTSLMSVQEFDRKKAPLMRECVLHKEIRGELIAVDARALLSELESTDRPIKFDRFEAARRLFMGPPSVPLVKVEGAIDLRMAQQAHRKAVVEFQDGLLVITPPKRWSYGATIPLRLGETTLRTRLYLKTRLRVLRGEVALGVLNSSKTDFLVRHPLRPTAGFVDLYLAIDDLGESSDVVIQSWRDARGGKVLIKDLQLFIPVTAEHSTGTIPALAVTTLARR